MTEAVIILALAATTVVKVLVDLVRMGIDQPPRWLSPVLAVVFGIAAAFLLTLANGQAMTGQQASICVLAGILAGGAAVGVTELQKKAA